MKDKKKTKKTLCLFCGEYKKSTDSESGMCKQCIRIYCV